MKKILLGTTALVASGLLASPAFAADPIKINVIGYLQSYIGIGKYDQDGSSGSNKYGNVNFKYEGEIWFQGQSKLDNGTTIGLRIELEAWSQGGITASSAAAGVGDTKDTVDEEYLFAFGDWGRIEFGGTDAASYKMTYTTPTALIGHSFVQHNFGWRGNTATGANAADHSGFTSNSGLMAVDANKFTYFTPRIAGFQGGFSYTPQFSPARINFAAGNAAQCGFLGGGGNTNACANNSNTWRHGLDFGANYLNKFGDVSLALYGGYAIAFADRAGGNGVTDFGAAFQPGTTNTSNAMRNWEAWALGVNVGFYGWTLGGGVGQDNNGLQGNRTFWYTAGAMYETGPWQASLGWWHGERRESNATVAGGVANIGTDKVDYFTLGVNYAIGPGVKLVGGFIYDLRRGQTQAEKADAWQFLFGTELRF
jgi:outer membrane protein OmpU